MIRATPGPRSRVCVWPYWNVLMSISLHVICNYAAEVHSRQKGGKIIWWPNPPYIHRSSENVSTSSSFNDSTIGLYQWAVWELLSQCQPDLLVSLTLREVRTSTDYSSYLDENIEDTSIFVAVSAPRDEAIVDPIVLLRGAGPLNVSSVFLPIVELPGAVHFYKELEEAVGSDLLTVIVQGWPLLVIILLGAGYSGIIIWLLDRLWNPANFPKPFIRGFWEGFWWAFVTMTTVGYGDTTPRSIQARVYGLIWIVVGITILSVFTATVTTVLTQESLGAHQAMLGLQIGVVEGSVEYDLVVARGGHPVPLDSFQTLLQLLTADNSSIRGALVDQYSFAAQQHLLSEDILVEQLVPNRVMHGLVVVGAELDTVQCMTQYAPYIRQRATQILTELIQPITTKTTQSAESAQTLFQPRTIMYMWYGMAAWFCIFIMFIVWEFLYWRPKHRKRKVIKEQRRKADGKSGGNKRRRTAQNKNTYVPHVSIAKLKMQNGNARQKSPGYFNSAFCGHPETDSDVTSDSQEKGVPSLSSGVGVANDMGVVRDSASMTTAQSTDLETLIRVQKEEVDSFEQEMAAVRESWTQRQHEMHISHRDQRRKLLLMLASGGDQSNFDLPSVKHM